MLYYNILLGLYMFQNIETKNPLEIKHNVNSIQNNDCKNFNIENYL